MPCGPARVRTAPRQWGDEHLCDAVSCRRTTCQINIPPRPEGSAVAKEARASHGEREPRPAEREAQLAIPASCVIL